MKRYSMNQNTNLINALTYSMIDRRNFLPAKTSNGQLLLTPEQHILEKRILSSDFILKLIDGDLLSPQVLLNDINILCSSLQQRQLSRKKPIIASYYVVLTSFNFPEYMQFCDFFATTFLENLRNSTGITTLNLSITLLCSNSSEQYSVNLNNSTQKMVYPYINTCFNEFFKQSNIYTVNDIVNKLSEITQTQKVQRLKGFTLTKVLIISNILIFLIGYFMEKTYGVDLFYAIGCQHGYEILAGNQYWRLITSMFLHADLLHLLSNMYFLYICGEVVERFYGKTKFICIYLLTGLVGNILSLFLLDPSIISIGASGCCLGLGGIMIYLWINRKNNFLRYAQNMTSFILIILFNAFYGFISTESNINNWAHIGGLFAGIIGGFILNLRIFSPKDK